MVAIEPEEFSQDVRRQRFPSYRFVNKPVTNGWKRCGRTKSGLAIDFHPQTRKGNHPPKDLVVKRGIPMLEHWLQQRGFTQEFENCNEKYVEVFWSTVESGR